MDARLRRQQLIGIGIAILLALSVVLPSASHAQTTTQANVQANIQTSAQSADSAALQATIRAEILKDPRSAALTSAQVDALVAALASQAQVQGVTAQAIAYRPGAFVPDATSYGSGYQSGICTDISSPLCALGQALGFDNPDKEVPIGLWITSGLLIAIIWHMRRNPHLTATTPAQKPPSSGPLG
jgi:hypothetical protein